MSTPGQENQVQDNKADVEKNFSVQRKYYEKQIEAERQARMQAEHERDEARNSRHNNTDDDYSEPYVDEKRLDKKLNKFGEQTKQATTSIVQEEVQKAIAEERRQSWLKNNSDFEDVMQHAEKLYALDKELAETILEMPKSFERQKLVYKNIKALGLDKPPQKEPSIQEKIDANRRSPFYQPSGVGSAPYAGPQGDYSNAGQKAAYDKMKELQSRLRIK